MVLTVSFVISPVIGFLATVACASSRRLDASTVTSGPHDFAIRVRAVRLQRARVHRIPPPTSVTIAKRPSVGRDGEHVLLIWVRRQVKFRKIGIKSVCH